MDMSNTGGRPVFMTSVADPEQSVGGHREHGAHEVCAHRGQKDPR